MFQGEYAGLILVFVIAAVLAAGKTYIDCKEIDEVIEKKRRIDQAHGKYCLGCGKIMMSEQPYRCSYCRKHPLCQNCVGDLDHECVEDRRNELATQFRKRKAA